MNNESRYKITLVKKYVKPDKIAEKINTKIENLKLINKIAIALKGGK